MRPRPEFCRCYVVAGQAIEKFEETAQEWLLRPREQPHIDRTLSATPEQLASICTSSIIKMQTVVIDHTGAEPIRPQVLRSP